MYLGSLIFVIILFIIIFAISILLVIASDDILRLPGTVPFDELTAGGTLTLAVLVAIFVIGFVLALGVLVYYKSTLPTVPVPGAPDAPLSGYRTEIFLWTFLALSIIGVFIILAISWSVSSEISTFNKLYQPIFTPDQASNISGATSDLNLSMVLDVFFIILSFLLVALIIGGV
jgi:hypothetical protein